MQSFAADLFAMTHDAEDDMGSIENALLTLKSSFSGPTAPSAEQGQLWYDTTRSLLRHRGAASNWRGVIAGSEDFKIWVYANAVEEGFDEDVSCADCVIGLKGGSNAFATWGKRGQWVINDIATHPGHTHTGPLHNHKWYDNKGNDVSDRSYNSGGAEVDIANITKTGTDDWMLRAVSQGTDPNEGPALIDFWTTKDGTGITGGPDPTLTHTTGGAWRPQAAVGIMVYPKAV